MTTEKLGRKDRHLRIVTREAEPPKAKHVTMDEVAQIEIVKNLNALSERLEDIADKAKLLGGDAAPLGDLLENESVYAAIIAERIQIEIKVDE